MAYEMTAEGKKELEEERHYRETVLRAEIAERLRIAREHGDLSENSEFDDAKNAQNENETRISELNRILSDAVVVTNPKDSTEINIGSIVTVDKDGKKVVYFIVGATEADVKNGKISNESPVGSALVGHKKGDKVVAESPTGKKINMKVLKVEQS